MRYVRAREVFPARILKLIQEYVDGECVYIPRKEGWKKSRGESTDGKAEISMHNNGIGRDLITL